MGLASCVVGMGLGRGGEYFFLVEWMDSFISSFVFFSLDDLFIRGQRWSVVKEKKLCLLFLFYNFRVSNFVRSNWLIRIDDTKFR